jgi:predicted transcriptional regulator
MAKTESPDPFVCNDEVQVDEETSRILKERIKSADEGRLVSAEEARQRIREWLSKSSTTKTR